MAERLRQSWLECKQFYRVQFAFRRSIGQEGAGARRDDIGRPCVCITYTQCICRLSVMCAVVLYCGPISILRVACRGPCESGWRKLEIRQTRVEDGRSGSTGVWKEGGKGHLLCCHNEPRVCASVHHVGKCGRGWATGPASGMH